MSLEHSLYELHTRLVRTEESNTALSSKCQALSDGVAKCHQVGFNYLDPDVRAYVNALQWGHDISHFLLSILPEHDNPIRRDGMI